MLDQLTTSYAMEVLRGSTLAAEEVGVAIVIIRFNREAHKSGRPSRQFQPGSPP